jgi:activator of 2-hydroxyglutaryl-CoA dehydratase
MARGSLFFLYSQEKICYNRGKEPIAHHKETVRKHYLGIELGSTGIKAVVITQAYKPVFGGGYYGQR